MNNNLIEVNQLKGMVMSSLLEGVKKGSTRTNDNKDIIIHASSIVSLCPRQIHIAKTKKVKIEQSNGYLNNGAIVTFSIGLAVEDFIIKYLGRYSDNKAYFKYYCPNCRTAEIKEYNDKEVICDSCGIPMIRQQITLEEHIKDNIYIRGNPDLLLNSPILGDRTYVIELKTINKDDFSALNKPLISHIYQVKTYLWLIKHLDRSTVRKYKLSSHKGYIIYVCKTFHKDPIKVFKIVLDKEWENTLNNSIKEIKGKKFPDRVCLNYNSPIAKQCPFRDICFNKEG